MIAREEVNLRHRAEARLLRFALGGDMGAADEILRYLGSSNPHLRLIMQETIHDLAGTRVWHHLLRCLALQRWNSIQDCERRSNQQASQRIDQSITEVFTKDEGDWEVAGKEAVLRAGLYDPIPRIRYAAAYLLAFRGELSVIPVLDEVIEKGPYLWKIRAVKALAALNDRRCGPPLIRALAIRHEMLHQEARRALSQLGALAETALVEALKHPDSHIRWHAARGLGEIGDAQAVFILAEGLHDENHAVRWATARVLARLDAAAVPAILTVISHNKLTESFRQAAYHALHSMASRRTQERIQPLLDALRSPAADIEAPKVAHRMLDKWKTAEPVSSS